MKIEKHRILEYAIAVLTIAFLACLLLIVSQPTGSGGKTDYSNRSSAITEGFAAGHNDARGIIQVSRNNCYQGETTGECAARIVQEKVSGFYIWLVLCSVLQAIIGFLTWKVLTGQADAVERLERPLVFVLGPRFGTVGFKENADKTTFPSIEMCFQNYGRSPAVVSKVLTCSIVGYQPPTLRIFSDKDHVLFSKTENGSRVSEIFARHNWNTTTLGPDEQSGWLDYCDPQPLTSSESEGIARGTAKLWVFGLIAYSDVFGKSHETKFRWVYAADLDMLIVDGGVEFNSYT